MRGTLAVGRRCNRSCLAGEGTALFLINRYAQLTVPGGSGMSEEQGSRDEPVSVQTCGSFPGMRRLNLKDRCSDSFMRFGMSLTPFGASDRAGTNVRS